MVLLIQRSDLTGTTREDMGVMAKKRYFTFPNEHHFLIFMPKITLHELTYRLNESINFIKIVSYKIKNYLYLLSLTFYLFEL